MSSTPAEVDLAVGVVANSQGISFTKDEFLITWADIDKARNTLRFTDHILVTIQFAYGRSSDFTDSFITTQAEWKALKEEMMGRTIYFGEIAGKHSDVSLCLDASHIKEVKKLDKIVEFFNRSGWQSGNVDVRDTYEERKADGDFDD